MLKMDARQRVWSHPLALALVCLAACGQEEGQRALVEVPGAGDVATGGDRAPAELDSELREVTFGARDLDLHGTLHLPRREQGASLPALVLVHGSGPQSQDGTVRGQLNMGFGFEIPVLEQLAGALAEAGYVVLRFDKRSCGPFNQCASNDYPLPATDITAHDFVADVGAALDFLASRQMVDDGRLIVVGHSQGATFVPSLMRDRTDLVAGVMIAGNHRPLDEIVAYQLEFSRQLLRDAGVAEANLDTMLGPLVETVAQLKLLRAAEFDGEAIGGASVEFWRSMFAIGDEAPGIARSLDRPVLAIGGDYDWNVPPEEITAWQATFAQASPDPGHATRVLACVTHALNCVSQPDHRLIQPQDIGTTVDGSLVNGIVRFLDGALAR